MSPITSQKWSVETFASSRPDAGIVSHWALDQPEDGAVDDDGGPEVTIGGWVWGKSGHRTDVHIVLRTEDRTWSYPLNWDRPDVIRNLFGREPLEGNESLCGFLYRLPKSLFSNQGVILGFETEGTIYPAARIRLVLAEERIADLP